MSERREIRAKWGAPAERGCMPTRLLRLDRLVVCDEVRLRQAL